MLRGTVLAMTALLALVSSSPAQDLGAPAGASPAGGTETRDQTPGDPGGAAPEPAPVSPPPPPPPREGRLDTGAVPGDDLSSMDLGGDTEPERIVERLLLLEHRMVATQHAMLETLSESIQRIEGGSVLDVEARRDAVQRALLYNQQLEHLRRQMPRLERALETLGRDQIPLAALGEAERLREILRKNQAVIAERHRQLRGLYMENQVGQEDEALAEELEQLDEAEPEEEFDLPAPPDPDTDPIPETSAEAAQLLEFGAVQTPKHLAEIFERVAEDETPKGSLRRYRPFLH